MKYLWIKRIITAALFVSFTLETQAREIWITTPDLSSPEKQSSLSNYSSEAFEQVDLTPLFEALLSHPLSRHDLQSLFDLEKQAQSNFDAGKLNAALSKYETLLSALEKVPNVSGIEAITFTTYVRIAEIKTVLGMNDADHAWAQAHAWNPSARLSESNYRYQSVERFMRQGRFSQFYKLTIRAPVEATIFIDGRHVSHHGLETVENLEAGRHQIAMLLAGALWTYLPLELTKDLEVSLEATAAFAGTCEQPKFNGGSWPFDSKVLVLYSERHCERVFDGDKWFTGNGEPFKSAEPLDLRMVERFSGEKNASWFSRVTKSPWFWATLAVGGALLYWQDIQNRQPTVVPTQTAY